MITRKLTGFVVAGAVAIALAVGGYAVVRSNVSSASSATSSSSSSAPSGPAARPGAAGGGGSNARSGPAAGGAVGTVSNVSGTGFTLTTAGGQQVTVTTSAGSATAVAAGDSVLVLGTTNATTITATQVTVQPNGDGGAAAFAAAGMVPFQQGAPSAAKQVGQIPDYTEGSGTIVSGTAADQATEAALTAYPGGVVDRVVQLSTGEYEVHNIGVNWPHHIFVNQDFTVMGVR